MENSVEEIITFCRREFSDKLQNGSTPLPVGFVFFDAMDEDEDASLVLIKMARPVKSLVDIEDLAEHVRPCTDPDSVVAGLAFLMPGQLWKDLADDNLLSDVDTVGVIHIEYVRAGYKTWVIYMHADGAASEWKLHTAGYKTSFPSLVSDVCYGSLRGQA